MKKPIIAVFISIILLLTLSTQPLFAAAKTIKIKVTFVSAELIEKNSVGNEWWSGATINGKEVKEGATIVLNLKASDLIKLRAEAQEQDKYPDDGATDASVKVSAIGAKAVTKTLEVSVTENRGRYSGNVAKWEFHFKIQKG
ncbi:hypothetical protein FHS16_003210 [Paenibacillus endophyticus]|uniref:WxL domain-containing protein n=1 Tax=Paenibacillus endophyticus TaxID=1294268 RepID=A0A7W5C8N6_9BACL|nr:hypothetical protein [Paenibacillus endophyticus]MBB3153151.1 hypothetical protein [Paenibacillus endophyticus]